MNGRGGGRGAGRGAFLEMLKKKPLVQTEAPAESATPTTPITPTAPIVTTPPTPQPPMKPTRSIPIPREVTPSPPVQPVPSSMPRALPTSPGNVLPPELPQAGRGRANLLDKLKSPPAAAAMQQPAPALRVGMGRASLLSKVSSQPQQLPVQQSAPPPAEPLPPRPQLPPPIRPSMSGDGQGVTGSLAGLSLGDRSSDSDTTAPISRMGESGTPIDIMSNYLDLRVEAGKGIFRYETRFEPETDSPRVRNALLNQNIEALGNTKNFDGVMLYLPIRLHNDRTILEGKRHDGVSVEITIIFQKQQKPTESVQFFNILLNKVMRCLQMVRINRNNFNPRCAHKVEQHNMELWPGYITAIEEMEGGFKLNIDASHRVMRTDTVRDCMVDLFKQTKERGNYRDAVFSELVGMTVLTRYNNQTYRIDDIHWDKSPNFEFECKGKNTTLKQYYKEHWNLDVQDDKQPLLLHRATKKLSQGGTKNEEILLVPEFCYLTGLTDKIRSNFRIMKDLSAITQVVPEQRRQVIRKFVQDIKNTPVAAELLKNWGLQINDDLVRLKGRVLPVETINFGNGASFRVDAKADWGRATVSNPLLRTPGLKNWFICFTERDQRTAMEFVKMLKQVATTMKMPIEEPQKVALRNDSTQSYIQEIRKVINSSLDMVVAVVPTIRNDRYSAIKKLCCVESPVRSQVIVTKTISDAKKIKAVSEKIAIQMNCKLGGAPWALAVPFDNMMIVGIDVFHAGAGQPKTGSVAGFVASLNKELTLWHSSSCIQEPKQELIDLLKVCFINSIKAYKKKRGNYPDRIVVYRDGVGDGQLATVAQYEVPQLTNAFKMVDPSYSPKLTVIIVQKRINTRVMAMRGSRLDNPPPGTIVDSIVTRRNFYDFFLVPQTARQGTVTPTHYIVLVDEASIKTDHLQRLSYKLCHLYYNWPGTIRVPAPCQYAHKLAYLVGQSIQAKPNECLAESLYYL